MAQGGFCFAQRKRISGFLQSLVSNAIDPPRSWRNRSDSVAFQIEELYTTQKEAPMSGNHSVVVALFADEQMAEEAKDALSSWDKANDDIKLGAIGLITKKGDKVKTHVGHRTGRGLWAGAVVGLVAAMFPPVALVGGLLGGAALGGITGAFFKKPLNLTKEEVQRIAAELEAGKVALVATCDEDEAAPTRGQLESLGGTVWTYSVPEETLVAAAAELPATMVEDPAAQPDAAEAATTTPA
jgi:uncharacterized membrane protein